MQPSNSSPLSSTCGSQAPRLWTLSTLAAFCSRTGASTSSRRISPRTTLNRMAPARRYRPVPLVCEPRLLHLRSCVWITYRPSTANGSAGSCPTDRTWASSSSCDDSVPYTSVRIITCHLDPDRIGPKRIDVFRGTKGKLDDVCPTF
jgi:hypothetical protein